MVVLVVMVVVEVIVVVVAVYVVAVDVEKVPQHMKQQSSVTQLVIHSKIPLVRQLTR